MPLSISYIPISDPFAGVFMSREAELEAKWIMLAQLGIERRDDATPLVAWRDAIADQNGIPRADLDPQQGGCLDLWDASTELRNFVFFLA